MNTPVILREWRLSDATAVAGQANNVLVWNNVRDSFPHPYTVQDGVDYITFQLEQPAPARSLAIEIDGQVAGGIGIVLQEDVERMAAEIGYWLGEAFWGKGMMTKAVKQMTRYAFENFDIIKLFAPVFAFNQASMRVLEKAGFTKEAILKSAAIKNETIIDLHYYGLIAG